MNHAFIGLRRMEQIKRQVVVQRGSMVAALKILAEVGNRSRSSQNTLSSKSSSFQSEQDRTLPSISLQNKVNL